MSTPSEHYEMQWEELRKIDEQVAMMRRWGVLETDPGFQQLWSARGEAMGKLGLMKPRTTTLVETLLGFSPGEIRLWADAELGWMTEARERPGAPPVYKYVTDEVAEKIVKREVTPELEKELITPDEYLGE